MSEEQNNDVVEPTAEELELIELQRQIDELENDEKETPVEESEETTTTDSITEEEPVPSTEDASAVVEEVEETASSEEGVEESTELPAPPEEITVEEETSTVDVVEEISEDTVTVEEVESTVTETLPVVEEPLETEVVVEETQDKTDVGEVSSVVVEPVVEVEEPEVAAVPVVAPEAPVEAPQPIVKPLAEWTLEEVKAVMNGDVKRPSNISEKEIVLRGQAFAFRVDANYDKWGFKDTYNWLTTGELPVATSGGFYVNDPIRTKKKANEWTREELVEFLREKIPATLNAPEEELFDAVAVQWKLPETWADQEIVDFVLFNRKPEQTAGGIWINDRVRSKKPAGHWTKKELMAFVNDEISATPAATENDLYNAVRKLFGVSDAYTPDRLKQLFAEYKEEPLSMALQFVKHALDQYAAGMGKGAMVNEAGAAGFQTSLYRTMSRVLRLEGREFVDGWTMILDFVNAHRKTMFNEHNAFRGVSVITLSDRDRRNFEQLLNLAIKTAEPSSRYNQAQNTNFSVVLRGITDEAIRQHVLAYYNITK